MINLNLIRSVLNEYGYINSFLYLLHKKKLWDTKSIHFEPWEKTSVIDSEEFVGFLLLYKEITISEDKLIKFRKNRSIIKALDHVTYSQGKSLLSEITKMDNFPQKYRQLLRELDSLGSPLKFHYKSFGLVSPTSLRYLKVFLEIEKIFGPINNKKICEIGIGFGGQSYLIAKNTENNKFILYDLPPVLELAKMFHNKLGINCNFEYFDGRDIEATNCDLLISNFAFSELNREIQMEYMEKVILKSKSGYMIWNELSYKQLNGLSLREILSMIKGSEVKEECPLSAPNNKLIIWGKDCLKANNENEKIN